MESGQDVANAGIADTNAGLRLYGTVVAESGYADIAHFETGKCVEIGKWVFHPHHRLSRFDVVVDLRADSCGVNGASDRCKGHRHIL